MSAIRLRTVAFICSCLFATPFSTLAQGNNNPTPAPPDNTAQAPQTGNNPAPASQGNSTSSPSNNAPSLEDLGLAPDQIQANAQLQARLDRRAHMLKIHQRLGLITTVPMIATIATSFGAAGRSSTPTARDLHLGLGAVTGDLYFATAYYAIRAPRIPGTETRGPIRVHKILAWIHGPGMIATPILGAIAFDQRSKGERIHGIARAHSVVADVTYAAFGAAIVSVSFKF